ncbi:MAG: hypothetical protein GKR91_11510 [Pseudomonadales bacterium]|nr:hypothetical protein [Pseudomonadales bacterium]
MPVVSIIEEDILELQLKDHFTMEEIKFAFSEAVAKLPPDHKPALLLDIQSSNELKSMEELKDAAIFFSKHFDKIRPKASLCADEKVRFGIGRQFCAFAELNGFEAKCFYDCEESRAFLKA